MEKLITTPEIIFIEEFQNRLEMEGIPSQIVDDTSTFMNAGGYMTQYTLLVYPEDLPKALEVKERFQEENEKKETMPWCDKCGEEDVTKEIIKHKFSSIWYLILSPILILIGYFLPLGPLISWFFIIGGVLFGIQYFRGHTEELFTCQKCGNKFHRNL